MALMSFFKPKWQHRDPEVRRQAVQALTSEDAEILTRVAREDEAPAVRRLAIRRLSDLDLMLTVSAEDDDRDIRQFAHTRLSELLAGTHETSPTLDIRMEFLSRHLDADLLDFVALNGVEAELRRSAQDRITRENVLRDIAIKDTVLANRQSALERITDSSILEAVIRQTRKHDKQIYRQSRAKLDAIREAQERPARIKAESERICAALEAMGHGDNWQEELNKLQPLEDRWQAIAKDAEPDYQTRYDLARDAFMKASKAFREAREIEEREWATILARREALLAEVAQCKAQLQDTQELSADAETQCSAELNTWQTAWSQAGELPSSQALPLDERFLQDVTSIRQRLNVLRDSRQMQEDFQSLLGKAEQMMGSKRPVIEHEVKSLDKHWKAKHWPADSDRFTEGLQRFDQIIHRLRERLSHQRELRTAELERLPGMLDQLEVLLKEKTLKEAGPMHDRIQSSINHLQALGVSGEQLGSHGKRLQRLTPLVRELQSWRSWGADEARERLCAEMESLIGSEINPGDLAKEIRRLRSDWDHMRSDGGAGFKTLRKRFDKAASEAYKPCEIFFEQQAVERNNHLEVKHQLLERLDGFLASADWSHMDWKDAVKFQRQFSNDWRRAGPVDRRKSKEIESQYRSRIEVLNEHLAMERQRNLEQRKALIEKVRDLLGNEDINNAIDECKRLQTQWQTTVAGKRQLENAIWNEFREACDAVFSRRKQQQDAHQEIEKQNKAHKQQLCERIEGLAKSTMAELADAERQLHKILDEWKAIGPVAKSDSLALEKRFDKVRGEFQTHAVALREEEVRAQLDLLQTKAGYCMELEQLLEHPDPAVARPMLEDLAKLWSETPSLADTVTEQLTQQRYQMAKNALMDDAGDQRDRLLSELRANHNRRKELCLRMEILSGVESPAEEQQARMEFQANRLAEAIGQGVEDPVGKKTELEREWYLSGGAPASQEKLLQERFEKARQAGHSTA